MCRIAHMVAPDAFYTPKHRTLYAAIHALYESGNPVDMMTVTDELRRIKKLDEVGGVITISEISAECPTSSNIEHYATEIQKAYFHRSTAKIILEAAHDIQDKNSVADEVMTNILDKSARLCAQHGVRQSVRSLDAVKETLKFMEHVKSKQYTGGIRTGLTKFDNLVVEFSPGDLVFIAARPSIGKTSLGMKIIEHNGQQGVHGMMFTLEMSIKEIMQRLLSMRSGIPLNVIRSRYPLRRDQHEKVHPAAAQISDWPVIFDENRYENARQISNAIRATMVQTPLKYVVIDQLSKIVPDSMKDSEYRMHLNMVINGLKNTARSLGIVVFLLHQIGRDAEANKDHKPSLSNLKDTGKAEEDADAVILLHRPEHYNDPKVKNLKIGGISYDVQGNAEIIVAKNRQGATGSVAVGYRGSHVQFYNLDEQTEELRPTHQDTPQVTHVDSQDEDLPF